MKPRPSNYVLIVFIEIAGVVVISSSIKHFENVEDFH